ncbi:MAG TPA: hypothetical protein VG713_15180, partial [Pirellulales bacterium]|nr:hypothetical protein [Pirellulales bacterium]
LYFRAAELYGRHGRSEADLRLAASLAHTARQILPDNRDIRRLQLSTAIEVTPAAGRVAVLAGCSIDDVNDLLVDAVGHERWMVAVVACAQLAAAGTSDLLRESAPQLSPLALATRSADRRIRIAAIEAIGRLAAQTPYPGSSDVLVALDYFVRSKGARRAIVADVREQHARNVAGLLATQGIEAEIATDDRTLFELATTMPDCELILIQMTLVEPAASSNLARLRQDARTAMIPIGILASSDKVDRAEAIARRHPRTLAFVDAPIEAAAARAVAATASLGNGEQLTAADRLQQAQFAFDWLLAADDAVVSVDQWRSLEDAIASAVYVPSLSGKAVALLSRTGTATSQRLLIEIANNAVQPLAVRQAAVAALGESLVDFGTLLTTTEIAAQYDRYNSSQQTSREEQQLFAAILDQIELRAASDAPTSTAGSVPR